MQFRGISGLLVILTASLSVGCSMSNPTVRSQTPEMNGPIIGSAPGYGEFKKAPYLGRHNPHDFKPFAGASDHNFGYEGGFYAGPEGYSTEANNPYTYGGGNACDVCQGGQACPPQGCHGCGRGCGYRNGMPQHVQTYQFDWPQNMVYPQQGVPAGMVQYPYYTLRGPTDFFMK
jgi:hypothetical protein